MSHAQRAFKNLKDIAEPARAQLAKVAGKDDPRWALVYLDDALSLVDGSDDQRAAAAYRKTVAFSLAKFGTNHEMLAPILGLRNRFGGLKPGEYDAL